MAKDPKSSPPKKGIFQTILDAIRGKPKTNSELNRSQKVQNPNDISDLQERFDKIRGTKKEVDYRKMFPETPKHEPISRDKLQDRFDSLRGLPQSTVRKSPMISKSANQLLIDIHKEKLEIKNSRSPEIMEARLKELSTLAKNLGSEIKGTKNPEQKVFLTGQLALAQKFITQYQEKKNDIVMQDRYSALKGVIDISLKELKLAQSRVLNSKNKTEVKTNLDKLNQSIRNATHKIGHGDMSPQEKTTMTKEVLKAAELFHKINKISEKNADIEQDNENRSTFRPK